MIPHLPGLPESVYTYDALLAFGITTLLLAVRKRMKRPGELFLLFGALYGLARFGTEFLRYRSPSEAAPVGLYPAQLLELAAVLACGGAWLLVRRRHRPPA